MRGFQIQDGVKAVSQSVSLRVSQSIRQSVMRRETDFRWKWRAAAIAEHRGAAGRVGSMERSRGMRWWEERAMF